MPGLAHSGNRRSFLYKNEQNVATPCRPWLAAMCTHLIHSPIHSFRGQVEKLKAAIHKALRADLKLFCLTLNRPAV